MSNDLIDEIAFEVTLKAAKLEGLAEKNGARPLIRKLFETYETAKRARQPQDKVQRVADAIRSRVWERTIPGPPGCGPVNETRFDVEDIAREAITAMEGP